MHSTSNEEGSKSIKGHVSVQETFDGECSVTFCAPRYYYVLVADACVVLTEGCCIEVSGEE